jgi:hypothetical protein
MRVLVLLMAGLTVGCATTTGGPRSTVPELARAEALVDAFYSFDPARLRALMGSARGSRPRLLYYQGWAEGGNYVVVDRKPCRSDKTDEVRCDITVRDDLMPALGIDFDVTDTFHIRIRGGRIVAVRNSSNDPPELEQAFMLIARQRPTLLEKECRGFFNGGPTPQACVREVVEGLRQSAAAQPK